jgi:hypothetical protein
MYLIEGCLEFIRKYKLEKGDVIVFARKADGTLVLGGRAAGPVRPPMLMHAKHALPTVVM